MTHAVDQEPEKDDLVFKSTPTLKPCSGESLSGQARHIFNAGGGVKPARQTMRPPIKPHKTSKSMRTKAR
jgi:hypothetical protein